MEQEIRLTDRQKMLRKEIRAWLRLNQKRLQQRIDQLTLKERGKLALPTPLEDSIKSSTKTRSGFIERVAYSFFIHGIFLETGTGRGRKKGSAAARKAAKPWIQPVISDHIDELADIIAENYADLVAEFISTQIPNTITFDNG